MIHDCGETFAQDFVQAIPYNHRGFHSTADIRFCLFEMSQKGLVPVLYVCMYVYLDPCASDGGEGFFQVPYPPPSPPIKLQEELACRGASYSLADDHGIHTCIDILLQNEHI